jgi:hypothetical protein
MTPCFDDWKRFCFVLREIASGNPGRPLSGLEAKKRAQGVLTECGYRWVSGELRPISHPNQKHGRLFESALPDMR